MDFRQTIITDFLTHVRLNPEKPAVMDRYGADSYGKLNRRSIRLARKILDACRERGTDVERLRRENRDGARIVLLLPRTCDYMTALLAVIRAGCAARCLWTPRIRRSGSEPSGRIPDAFSWLRRRNWRIRRSVWIR